MNITPLVSNSQQYESKTNKIPAFGIKIDAHEKELLRFIDKLDISATSKFLIFENLKKAIAIKNKSLNSEVQHVARTLDNDFFGGKKTSEIITDKSKKGIETFGYELKITPEGDSVFVSSKVGQEKSTGSKTLPHEQFNYWEHYYNLIKGAIFDGVSSVIDKAVPKNSSYLAHQNLSSAIKKNPSAEWSNMLHKYGVSTQK